MEFADECSIEMAQLGFHRLPSAEHAANSSIGAILVEIPMLRDWRRIPGIVDQFRHGESSK
jgi:hypothetical protein